jgi:dihydrofolate reductase
VTSWASATKNWPTWQVEAWCERRAGVPDSSRLDLASGTEFVEPQCRRHREHPTPMNLTVQTFLTLDGVMQAPGGPEEDPSDGFTHGGWSAPFGDPAVGEFVVELNSHASAFLLGRRTFDIFRGHWPDQTDPEDPLATAINSLPKYVVSNSLNGADATWRGEHPGTARLVTGDVVASVRALKNEPGDELQIWGSGQLLQTLLQHQLVDRFRLMTFPVVLGSGRRLFNDGILAVTMRPVDITVTDGGIVLGTYEPAGPAGHGRI